MADHRGPSAAAPMLAISDLHVHYGRVPVLPGLNLKLDRGVVAVVGRNGMGKSTLCKAVTGLVRPTAGSIYTGGESIAGLPPHRITRLGVGYVPQGRRCWPSLTVDEHLRLASRKGASGEWTLARVYDAFPRLKERRRAGGAQLSGGEQQMLAISRALIGNPRLLIMDEPTEGLAPVVVQQIEHMIRELVREGRISVLLIEQQLGVALDIADRVAIMLHGQIEREMLPAELKTDPGLQRRLLGVGRHADDPAERDDATESEAQTRYIRVERQHGGEREEPSHTFAEGNPLAYSARSIPNRWSADNRSDPSPAAWTQTTSAATDGAAAPPPPEPASAQAMELPPVPVASLVGRTAYVVGTFDTKRDELMFIANCLKRLGVRTTTVDLATGGRPSPADIGPREVAGYHSRDAAAVFTHERGTSVAAMAEAFERFMRTRRDVGGLISAGGSSGTSMATAGMRALPVGTPKFMVSTVASSDVSRYVGPSDISMMYSVTDVQGINAISEQVLSNAAHALAGMIGHRLRQTGRSATRPAIGLTMFGVTTPCVQAVQQALAAEYDSMTFHATGTGGRSMEKLVESGLLAGVIDITTTEVPDLLVGGVFPADHDRFGAIIRR
ncbi:MAG: Tm-1-like ATP-binding domain-containing protein, partial [Xanthobacteraceae bacterium]